MKKGTWRKQHKWLGIGLSFFMLMFCVSGILLNHRSLIKEVNVSRKYLPSRYEFQKWNGGLLRGTLDIGKCSGLLAVIDKPFVAILQHLDVGFRDGNGVYEGCTCIAGEKKQVTANG